MLIFNFHHVEENIRQESRRHITVTPEGLRKFIRTIRAVGMEPICLREVLAKGGPQPEDARRILITFDDGYENVYQYGVPVLEEEKCPATIFVLPGKFSGTNDWDQGDLPVEQRDALMSLEQMKALSGSVVTLASHGMEHRNLPTLSRKEIEYEVFNSYEILSRELGENFLPVFAYPWGAYSSEVLDVMAQSKYQYSFTVNKGHWQTGLPAHEIPRYSAYYRDGNPFVFLAKLCRNGLLFTSVSGQKVLAQR